MSDGGTEESGFADQGWPGIPPLPDAATLDRLAGMAGLDADSGRAMYRYAVPVDDRAHRVTLTGDPVAVAAAATPRPGWAVEFWAEHVDGFPGWPRDFQVFGTGHPIPHGAKWIGTCPRTANGLVWHLYEVTP